MPGAVAIASRAAPDPAAAGGDPHPAHEATSEPGRTWRKTQPSRCTPNASCCASAAASPPTRPPIWCADCRTPARRCAWR
ncbi:hypothetical protein [Lysobacter gummosus]|uniref:hypothetical protein n=1 Tax=Lysobacter gummosus TaxID=262324 RepID=UPI0036424205